MLFIQSELVSCFMDKDQFLQAPAPLWLCTSCILTQGLGAQGSNGHIGAALSENRTEDQAGHSDCVHSKVVCLQSTIWEAATGDHRQWRAWWHPCKWHRDQNGTWSTPVLQACKGPHSHKWQETVCQLSIRKKAVYFRVNRKDAELQISEYINHSFRQLISQCSQEPGACNTVRVSSIGRHMATLHNAKLAKHFIV